MTHTRYTPSDPFERRARVMILAAFLRSRISDEIAHEADRYHHDSCQIVLLSPFSDCTCDGPDRTRQQLEAMLAVVELVEMRIHPSPVELAALEAVGDVYSGHTNYPARDWQQVGTRDGHPVFARRLP